MTKTHQNCPHCGRALSRPDATFCTNCGAPLSSDIGTAKTVHGGTLAKIIVHEAGEETREEFLSKAVTSLGRRSHNDIVVASPIVSGAHARVDLTRQGHTITDLNSTNGTYVNGKRLNPHEPYQLATNDIIRFNDTLGNSAAWLTYVAPTVFSDVAEIDMVNAYHVTEPVSYIGRNPQAAISFDHPAVSWNHARIERKSPTEYAIEDLSSNNGTFINGRQLRESWPLQRGDVIQTGPFNLVYQGAGQFVPFSAERNFRLEAVDIEKTVYPTTFLGLPNRNKPKTILQTLNIVINPREFVALVGGSGTGKSTLLKSLSGVTHATSGTVLVNGDNLYDNFDLYRTMMGYVPQDDIIHQSLTVRQGLQYAARLRLPDAGPAEVAARIQDVLEKVGLTRTVDTVIRNLSGGQRKRVSIAAELLAEPWIFFLDEPTSGLDPGLEKLMMDTMRQLADEGRTIILVTHATDNIANNCDQVAFLARGGELAYYGPPDKATEFFKVDHFPDIYTRLSQTFKPDHDPTVTETIKPYYNEAIHTNGNQTEIPAGTLWAKHYRQSAFYQTYIANRQSGEMARPKNTQAISSAGGVQEFKQFVVLAQRYLNLIRQDRLSLVVLLAVMPIIGLFLLLISNGSALVGHTAEQITAFLETDGSYAIANQAQTLLFMMALSANLLGIFGAAYEIIKEEPIYRRERMINLRILPYFMSKFVILGAFMLLQCLLLLLVLSLNVSMPATGAITWAPIEYYFTLVFTALASLALGLFLSAIARSRDMIIYLVLVALFGQIVFSGAIFELSGWTSPLSYLTITRWSLEALGASTDMDTLNELGQVRVEREIDYGRGTQTVIEDVSTTIDFYVAYPHNAAGLISRWLFLLGHILLWSGLTIWFIRRKDALI